MEAARTKLSLRLRSGGVAEVQVLAFVDDTRLMELAADRPAELFPALRRASAFKPLLVVLCAVPALYAMEYGAWSEVDSLWGLRSVPIVSAADINGIVDPETRGPEAALKWQPLFGNWLTAISMHVAGPARIWGQALVPYLSTVALIAMCYFLFVGVSGQRIAFWMVLLTAFHGPILELVSDHAPFALSIALGIGAFLGFLRHLTRGDQTVSFDLLLGGTSLGLCLLAGGPLALVVILILMLHVLGLRGEKTAAKRGRPVPPRRVWVGWPALKSLAILSLTAFAVGGWWVLMMFYSYGTEFWVGWLAGNLHGEVPALVDESAMNANYWKGAVGQFVGSTGMLTGVALLGVWSAGYRVIAEVDEKRRRQAQFLVSWWVCAAFMFLLTANSAPNDNVTAPLWRLFLLVASIGAASIAIDDISRRLVRVETVGALTLATMFIGYVRAFPEDSAWLTSTFGIMLWILAAATLFWGLHRLCSRREARQRTVLVSLVVAHLVANAFAGLYSCRAAGANDRALKLFRTALSASPDSVPIVLVADDEPPLRLQYAVRSLWPEAELRILRVQDDAPTAWNWNEAAAAGVMNWTVIEWSRRDTRLETTAGDENRFTSVGSPQNFLGRALRAWRVEKHIPE